MWSNIKTVYYGATPKDTEDIEFRDNFMYEWLKVQNEETLKIIQLDRKECVEVQQMWLNKEDKIKY